jgi:hypothetical protein
MIYAQSLEQIGMAPILMTTASCAYGASPTHDQVILAHHALHAFVIHATAFTLQLRRNSPITVGWEAPHHFVDQDQQAQVILVNWMVVICAGRQIQHLTQQGGRIGILQGIHDLSLDHGSESSQSEAFLPQLAPASTGQ